MNAVVTFTQIVNLYSPITRIVNSDLSRTVFYHLAVKAYWSKMKLANQDEETNFQQLSIISPITNTDPSFIYVHFLFFNNTTIADLYLWGNGG